MKNTNHKEEALLHVWRCTALGGRGIGDEQGEGKRRALHLDEAGPARIRSPQRPRDFVGRGPLLVGCVDGIVGPASAQPTRLGLVRLGTVFRATSSPLVRLASLPPLPSPCL
ncbi:hypothetical protein BHM03_00040090, partial [Ensete ventricosum]